MKQIGFTGTQQGMTNAQKASLRVLLTRLAPQIIHSGDCIGADKEFHTMAKFIDPAVFSVGHPPDNNRKRAFCGYNVKKATKPYLVRNREIVAECDMLIACPKKFDEQLRSGTWATVRAARKAKKPIAIIFPDGTIREESGDGG